MLIFFIFSSIENLIPTLPVRREKRSVSSSASIVSNRSHNTASSTSLLLPPSHEQTNDERIQLILDDINYIVEKYTRELDDNIYTKSAIRSPSTSYISQQNHSSISSCRHYSIDTLYDTKHSLDNNYRTRQNALVNINEHRTRNVTNDPPPLPPKRQIGNLIY